MKTILLTTLFFTFNIFAQDPRTSIQHLLREIQLQVNATQDLQQLRSTERRLQTILADLSNTNPNPPVQNPGLVCIARDNDNREPWILAVRHADLLTITKLPNSNLGSLNNCQQSKNISRHLVNSLFVCITQDNDGKAPFALGHYQQNSLKNKFNFGSNLTDCTQSLSAAIQSQVAIAFCASRDNDGRAPFVIKTINTQTLQTQSQGNFSSLESCLQANNKIKLN